MDTISVSLTGNNLAIRGLGLARKIRLYVLADAHLSVDDERGEPHRENSRRMAGGYRQGLENFTKLLSEVPGKGIDQVLLLGDMISFPSCLGVETVMALAQGTGVPFAYTAGNHDWHFEGLPGTEIALRQEWSAARLAPLYQGKNPLCYTVSVGGVDVAMMDTSAIEILPEQLSFWREQVKTGRPTLLCGHIPLYVPGRGPVDFGVGHPDWNASTDKNWEIERRERWPESGHSATTMAFYNEVFAAPNLLGIVAGHVHVASMDFHRGKFQYVLQAAAVGGFAMITCE